MIDDAIKRLEYLINTIPPLLKTIDEASFSSKPQPHKWSKKEIIGHLIDSAANNHQRFIRVQFEDEPSISYDQEKWNQHGFYQEIDGDQVITFWTVYNKQLLELIRHISPASLQRKCRVKDEVLTLEFLIHDYVEHMEHHLRQVVTY